MNYLVVSDDLALVRAWVLDNPTAKAWFYGKGLPTFIEGLEGKVLSSTLTLKEAKAWGEFGEIVELPPKPAKKAKKGAVKDEE